MSSTSAARKKWKELAVSAGILVGALLVGSLLCELLARMVLNKGDYLIATLEKDGILGHRIPPFESGHDALGFRNRALPNEADVVAIGDSWTYGVGDRANFSWPVQLQSMLHETVYSMAIGGYGPPQYSYLLESKAPQFHPRTVVIGIYLGNDLFDSVNVVYSYDYWKKYRKFDPKQMRAAWEEKLPTTPDPVTQKTGAGIRDWLARRRLLYNLVKTATLPFFNKAFIRRDQRISAHYVVVEDQRNLLNTVLNTGNSWAMDLGNPAIAEGLRLSLVLVDEMHEFCRKSNRKFIVAIFSTKERVYAEYIRNNSGLPQQDELLRKIALQDQIIRKLRAHCESHSIRYVDPLSSLTARLGKEPLFSLGTDSHPVRAGYKVIAESIAQAIQESPAGAR